MAIHKSILNLLFIISFLLSMTSIKAFDGIPKQSTYSTTWSSSQYLTEPNNLPPIPLSENSIRQIVHVSISSPTIRLKFSNREGDSDLEIKAVSLANSVSQGSGEIDVLTLTPVTFSRKEGVLIPAGSEVYSDPFYYPLKTQSEVAISIYFGEVPSKLTSHAGSRTFSFIEKGNKINEKKFSDDLKTAHWYVITSIEVSSSPTKKTVVCFGDSITDGRGSTDDKQNRWTDVLSKKLYLNDDTINVGVVNAGIGGTLLRTSGLERFERDVLNIKGVAYVIVLYGVNDILFSDATVDQIIDAYKILIKKAHEKEILIYGATILPFGRNDNWSKQRDNARNEVNDWIRNSIKDPDGFDSYFDFDQVIRDPKNISNIYDKYDCNDGLHPSPEGYKRMVDAIDNLKLFTIEYNKKGEDDDKKDDDDDEDGLEIKNQVGIKFKLDFDLEEDEEVTVTVKGKSNFGSYGFRIVTNNDDGKKTSDYFYTGRIENGKFDFSANFKVLEKSNYIVIRRPISTLNINNIFLSSVEVDASSGKKKFNPKEEGIIIK